MTQAYPLQWPEGWPRTKSYLRKRAKFGTGERQYSKSGTGSWMTRKELSIADGTKRIIDELRALGVGQGAYIISSDLELRNDGLPRSSQRAPDDPGVAVYWFRWRDGRREPQKVMAIDLYDRVADNLAAIAATLNAMRAIERHGGAQILERAFTGFDALPPPKSCWEILGLQPGASAGMIATAFRRLAMANHPDHGGSTERMAEITAARDAALRTAA
jgi:DnaJ-class molecular chaperone with C-terminal Zn finger domain